MKKLSFIIVLLAMMSCSSEALDTGSVSLDAKSSQLISSNDSPSNEWTYINNGGKTQGKVLVSNDCESVTLQFVEMGSVIEDGEFDLTTSLPELNNGGQINGGFSYSLEDLDDNLSFTISFEDLGITHEDDLYIFAKAWGKWAGTSEYGRLNYFTYDVEEKSCACEESFDYVKNPDGSYTFTYIPAEDMEDAHLTFTFPQAEAEFTKEGWTKNGKENAQTWSQTRDLTACMSYEWNVTLTRICMGSTNNNNVWTDFKVGEASKKGELENITQACPE